jgi:hypothetical protein
MLFDWKCQPKAEGFLLREFDRLKKQSSLIQTLEKDLEFKTSTRLFDWLSHLTLKNSDAVHRELLSCGFNEELPLIFYHPGAQLPRVQLSSDKEGIAIIVDSIADFLMVRGLNRSIEGAPLSSFRRASIGIERGVECAVVERRSGRALEPTDQPPTLKYIQAKELWQRRPRDAFGKEAEYMMDLHALAKQLVDSLGRATAAYLVLEVERAFWQSKNRAGQIQKNRQDHLGMGWSNHDHHTFRSSRSLFFSLIQLFEILGFHCRERFYAGKEAGWGAQVMEHHDAHLVLFLDVDLTPDELAIDFAHQPLKPLNKLGTIGLWCALHGDSIFEAGMHHLEAQFNFDELKSDLSREGVDLMKPFSDFSYLKQAFTKGEMWLVNPIRLQRLLEQGLISAEQQRLFAAEGALGSHLENLQRREGYKGFNQHNVSLIIKETDPRANL